MNLRTWSVIAVLSAAMAFSLVDRFALSLLFEPIKADLGLSDTQLGMLHGIAFGLFYATMGIPIAWLVDRWSRKWVIFWGIGLWSLMTALCGLSRSYLQLLGARIGVGVGEAALAPAGYSIITDIVPAKRLATAISVFQMGSLFGGGLAFALGGAILTAVEHWDSASWPLLSGLVPWQLTFIVLALPGIPFLLLIWLIREPTRIVSPNGNAAPAKSDEIGLFRYLQSNWRTYASLFVGNSCLIGISYGNVTWTPSIFARQFGWSPADTGILFGTAMLFAAPAGVLLGGLLADHWRSRGLKDGYARVLLLAAWSTLPLIVITQVAQSAWVVFTALAITQFFVSVVIGTGPATIQTMTDVSLRGRVSAVYVFMVNIIGLGVGPILIGALSDVFFTGDSGVLRSLGVYAVLMLAVAIVLLTVFQRRYLKAMSDTLQTI